MRCRAFGPVLWGCRRAIARVERGAMSTCDAVHVVVRMSQDLDDLERLSIMGCSQMSFPAHLYDETPLATTGSYA